MLFRQCLRFFFFFSFIFTASVNDRKFVMGGLVCLDIRPGTTAGIMHKPF